MREEEITQRVSERYARAAATGEQICCPTGYNFEELRSFIPEEVLKISYGCGTPAGLETVRPGETVLDVGSGGGIDCFEAARRVGSAGRVIGIDMTDTMLEIARRNAPGVARNLGYAAVNVEFRKGMADSMPVEDESIDLIISNCVINLAPDKRKVFQEMHRVLKPGGRFTISDIVSDQPVPNYLIHDAEKWGNCLSGALQIGDYMAGMAEAGFRGLHQLKFIPWQVIDGIHFLSITLTGYKVGSVSERAAPHATLRGPFSRIVTEDGLVFERGMPARVDARNAEVLSLPGASACFLFSDSSRALSPTDPGYCSILPESAPCIWKGDYAFLIAPFLEAQDDDGHLYRRGVPLEICSKTRKVLDSKPYRPHFAIINRASGQISGTEVSCSPSGACC